jgi:putative tricarboxylic transport membrane protein
MLMSQGDMAIMWANPLVGSITGLALLLLFWPLLSKAWARIRRPKPVELSQEQPVD